MEEKERQKERRRKEDGKILCQSLIKKDELGTDSAVLGTGQTPVASPSCIVPVCMALLNTVTEDRVQAREGLLRFLVQTLLVLLRLILFLFLFLFFNAFLSRFLFFILCSFFFLFFVFLLFSIRICRFLSSLFFHRSNNTILLWFLDR